MRVIPSPQSSPETEPFWAAAAEGRLLLGKCQACGRHHYYPRTQCPYCSTPAEWVDAKGGGVIYTFSIMRRAPVPYVIAMVSLDEGVTLMTNIVDCDPETLAIGERVRLTFKPAEDGTSVPMFTPCLQTSR
ncbi:MAG: Zn-ribbon domain-containing OB-fold protein [Pigmentiphaga sp.]